jgi:hypothetical protein
LVVTDPGTPKLNSMKNLIFAAALLWLAAAAAASDDVGLVNHLSGDASFVSGKAKPAKATAYMKVREGDRFTLAKNTQLRLVYFQGGRQESYTGPGRFTAGKQESSVQSGAKPQVTTLPSGVSQRIAQTPELMQIAKLGRAGGVAVRSGARPKPLTDEQQAEIKDARLTYQRLRETFPADDITPELYLFTVLEEHRQYDDLKPVVAEMQRRQPKNADVRAMADYVEAKSQGK